MKNHSPVSRICGCSGVCSDGSRDYDAAMAAMREKAQVKIAANAQSMNHLA